MKLLIDRPDGTYCFREMRDRVFYVSEKILALAENFGPDHLLALGTCIGKFTKSGKFRLHITALAYLAPYAQVIFQFNCNSFPLFNVKCITDTQTLLKI